MENKELHQDDISKVAKNAGISGVGEFFYIGIQYLINVIIVKIFGANVFGLFIITYTIIKIAQILSDFGLSEGILRYVSFYKSKNDNPRIKGLIISGSKIVLLSSVLITIIIFFSSEFICINIFHKPELNIPLKILIFSLPFFSLLKIWLGCIQGYQLIKYRIFIEKIYIPFIWLIFLILFNFLGYRINAAIISLLISYIIGTIISFYYLKKYIYKELIKTTPFFENKNLIKFSLPLFFSGALNLMMLWTNILLLGYLRSASEVGIYEFAVKAATLVIIPLNSVNTIFAPMISEYYSLNAWEKLENMFKIATKWIFTLSFPIFLILVIFNKPIMNIFGKDFEIATAALIILGLGQLINAATGSVGYMLNMTGYQNISFYDSLILYVLNLILNFILIPRYGILGSAIATSSAIGLINLLRLIEVYYFLGIHPYKFNYWKSICAGIISTIICLNLIKKFVPNFISFQNFLVFSSIFIFLYLLLIYLFKLEEEEVFIFRKFKGKIGL